MAAPANVMASCVPIQGQSLKLEPGTVVMTGTVTQVTAGQVVLVVGRWWGDDVQTNAAVDRPAVDPTVISSTDWNPQPGEAWLIVARRTDGSLTTDVRAQTPSTPETIAELDSTLGPGSDPRVASPTTAGQPDMSLPLVVGGAVLAALLAIALFAASRRRNQSLDADSHRSM